MHLGIARKSGISTSNQFPGKNQLSRQPLTDIPRMNYFSLVNMSANWNHSHTICIVCRVCDNYAVDELIAKDRVILRLMKQHCLFHLATITTKMARKRGFF